MNGSQSQRAIILAPRGRDAAIAATMLRDGGIDSHIAADLGRLVKALDEGAGFALVTDEAFHGANLRALAAFIEGQEEWSDFPFILLTERGGSIERNPAAGRFLDLLGNVTFLERPFHPTTLISIAKSALRGRLRQYEARERLQTIRESEQQLRFAMDAGRLGAWSLDLATMTLEASDHCKENFGRSADDDFSYAELIASVHPDDLEAMQRAVERTIRTGADYDIEYRCVWPDSTIHWVQVRGRPEHDGGSAPTALVGVSQDITARKQAETTLRNFAAELEDRVDERTREREAVSAQLHEAQKLETLGQLTGGVAHDFNNLLTPIVGTLDLVRRKVQDPKTQKLVDGAMQASERARILVARLLAFARRQNLETRPVDVAALVDGMVDLIQRSIGPTIKLELGARDHPAVAFVDPNQLELALLNLAVNARDAMPDGGQLTVEISPYSAAAGHPRLDPGDYVMITVADSGSGMDRETLARAVEPFYSTKGIGKGTGLGLSMVHGLAAQSGGALDLESGPGEGTTAILWLPAAPAQAIAEPEKSDGWKRGEARLSVLLVDDEDLVREATAAMLAELGHDIVEADSGAAALSILRSQQFDIVVTDYLMPAMSGLELAREVQKVRGDLPILMITGFADLVDGKVSEIAQLSKPFQINELARAIQHEVESHAVEVQE